MAAWQLVQQGVAVTVLESGQDPPQGMLIRAFGRNLYRKKPQGGFGSDCQAHRSSGDPGTKWYFSHSLGGLSNRWTGAVPRFAPEDFNEGARLHEKYEWPLSYADLEPYYDRVERLMDVVGSGADVPNLPGGYTADIRDLPADWKRIAACMARLGQGLTTLPIADGPPHLVAKRGTAFNSYTNILQPLMSSRHFDLRRGAHVLRVDWSPERRRAVGVTFRDGSDGREHQLEADAIVLAAGSLHSTRILFDSVSADFPNGLGNGRDLLGRYLHDHPREWWVLETAKPLSRLSPSIYLTRRAYAESEPLLATAWTFGAPSTREKLLGFTGLKSRQFGVQVFGTMVPTPTGRVTPLRGSSDENGASKLDIDVRFDDASLRTLRSAQGRLIELMAAADVPSRVLPVPPDQVAPGSSVHYGGTARMHRSPEYGVVDTWNRLFDCPNVLVCDAACFTTGAEKNPTLTAMALAARACEQLSRDITAGAVRSNG